MAIFPAYHARGIAAGRGEIPSVAPVSGTVPDHLPAVA